MQGEAMSLNASHKNNDRADGSLLALLVLGFYGLFTLLPGSNTLMVSWPWVFLWQVAWLLPVIWLLWQLWFKPVLRLRLGDGLDWIVLIAVIGLGTSTLLAEFPQQAFWYAWAALGAIAALYGLNGWLTTTRRIRLVLTIQGSLAIAFILLSLGLWISQIYLPEIARINALSQYGIQQSFDFGFTSLRNWQPIGHQNYVAGYLVLVLPLLTGLAVAAKGIWRGLWAAGAVLGLADLYTTSSRAGWLGLLGMVVIGFAIALLRSRLPRRLVVATGGVSLAILVAVMLSNDRIRQVLAALSAGNFGSGDLRYRVITNIVGWNMGTARPITGLGAGSVPLVYQKYRPFWAGREAELQYQLHSSPAQIWGELGGFGVLVALLVVLWLLVQFWRWQHRSGEAMGFRQSGLVWSLGAGLLAYGLLSLTDYQLENICIAGTLILYLAVLASVFSMEHAEEPTGRATASRRHRWLAGLGLGLSAAAVIWLVPVHQAWALSAGGFSAFERGSLEGFVQRLARAHQLAPWEAYYPYQLGWRLGDLSYRVANPEQAAVLRQDGARWLQAGLEASPYQEFGYSNLGWLLLEEEPAAAAAAFTESVRLMPAKGGIFFGLGFSLLKLDESDLALQAMTLEVMRHPMMLTSSVWRIGRFAAIYPQLLEAVEQRCTQLLATTDDPTLLRYLHQLRGGLRWWRGDLGAAAEDWPTDPATLEGALLQLSEGKAVDPQPLPTQAGLAIAAWQTPEQRKQLLEQAWIAQQEDVPQLEQAAPPADTLQDLLLTMNQASSFDQWLKQLAPAYEIRSTRLGFGVLSRHIDGPAPVDYFPYVANVPMNQFFKEPFRPPVFLPPVDRALQPEREALLAAVDKRYSSGL